MGPGRGSARGRDRGSVIGPDRGSARGPVRGPVIRGSVNGPGPGRGADRGSDRGSAIGPDRGSAQEPSRGSVREPARGSLSGPLHGPDRGSAGYPLCPLPGNPLCPPPGNPVCGPPGGPVHWPPAGSLLAAGPRSALRWRRRPVPGSSEDAGRHGSAGSCGPPLMLPLFVRHSAILLGPAERNHYIMRHRPEAPLPGRRWSGQLSWWRPSRVNPVRSMS